jgi:ribonuclease III
MNPDSKPEDLEQPEEFVKRLGLPFKKDILLLSRALTHRSYINEHPEALEDNERLEFLGDAILDFLVGEYLYQHYPEMPEGALTRMRSALVQSEKLADFARDIQLGRALRLGHGEDQAGGRDRTPILCDTFEALIAAIYLSNGLNGVTEFFQPLLETAAEEVLINQKIDDPKSLLQEWSQSHGLSVPFYNTYNITGPDHNKVFEVEVLLDGKVYGKGEGHSKQQAAKEAARQALNEIGANRNSLS